MENTKWHHVLLEWVNCLKLCKNIQDVNELRSGEFFLNVQKVITKNREANPDLLTYFFDLFSNHYPCYVFKNKTEIHLSDLPDVELKSLTSLLMHYTCIYDRRDVLTSPLCDSLSQPTQVIIRKFLEQVTRNVDNKSLDQVITSCINDTSDRLSNQWLSVATNTAKNSPLLDLLKTPISRIGRLQEKDRTITRLKSELEVERFEKADLQEELKQQVEKNKKIEAQLQQKSSEIARLKGEILGLENRTPPHYQDTESRDLQRRLRGEIQSLEQYIQQIEAEQEVIRNEKDNAKEQLRKLQTQSAIWEEKFFETERNFENLSEHSQKQTLELDSLQSHCAELTAMLDEYRKSPKDSFLENSTMFEERRKGFDDTLSCEEDLACSVVEVQLREAQKLNEELNTKIVQLEECSTLLKKEIKDVTEKLCQSESSKEDLSKKLHLLETCNENIQQQLNETANSLELAMIKNQEVDNLNSCLSTTLQQTSDNFKELQNNHKLLLLKTNTLEKDSEDLRKQLHETLSCLETSKKQSQELEITLNDSKKTSERFKLELDEVSHELNQIKTSFADVKNEKDTLLKALEEVNVIKTDLETRLGQADIKITELKSDLSQVRHEHDKVINDLATIKEEKTKLHTQLCDTENSLKIAENKSLELEIFKSDLEIKLQESATVLASLNHELAEIQIEKHRLECATSQLTEDNSVLLKRNDNMQNERNSLENTLQEIGAKTEIIKQKCAEITKQFENSEAKLRLSDETNQELVKKNQDLQAELDLLQIEVEKKTSEFQAHTESLKITLSQVTNDLRVVQEQTSLVQAERDSLLLQIQDLNGKMDTLEIQNQDYVNRVENLEKQLRDSLDGWESSKQQTNDLEESRNELQIQLGQADAQIQALGFEKWELSESIKKTRLLTQKLKNEKETLLSNLNALEATNKELILEMEELRRELTETVSNLQIAQSESKNYQKELETTANLNIHLEIKLKESKDSLEKLVEERDLLAAKLQRSDEALDVLKQEKTELLDQMETIKQRLASSQDDLDNALKESVELRGSNNALEMRLKEIQTDVVKIHEEKTELMNQLSRSEKKNEDMVAQINCLEKQIAEVTDDLTGYIKRVEDVQLDRQSLAQSCNGLMGELETIRNDLKLKQKDFDELTSENDSLKSKLNGLDLEIERLNKILNEKDVSCQQLEEIIKTSATEKTEIEVELLNTRAEYEATKHELIKAHERTRNLEIDNGGLDMKLELVTDQHNNLMFDFNTLLGQYQNMEKACAEYATTINSLRLELEVNRQSINAIHDELQQTGRSLEETDAVKEKLLERITELTNNAEFMEYQLSTVVTKRDELKIAKQHLEVEQKKTLETLSTLQEQVNALTTTEEECAELRTANASLEQQLNETNSLTENLQHKVEELQIMNEQIQSDLQEATGHLLILKAEKAEVDSRLEHLIYRNRTLDELNNNLHQQMAELDSRKTSVIELLQRQMDDLYSTLDEAHSDKDVLVNQCETLKQTVKNLELNNREVQNAHENELIETSLVVKTLKQELKNLQVKFSQSETSLKSSEETQKQLCADKEALLKELEEAKAAQEERKMEIDTMNEKLEHLSEEKLGLEKKIEVEVFLASESQEKMKSLEETVQDYSITISGLKSVVDNHLESLEVMKTEKSKLEDDLTMMKNKERETLRNIINFLKSQGIEIIEDEKILEVGNFVVEHVEKIFATKKAEERLRIDLEKKIVDLKNKLVETEKLNQEMIEKLQGLVLDQLDACASDCLKSAFNKVHEKIHEIAQTKQKLETDKVELTKQLETVKTENDTLVQLKMTLEKNLETEQEKVANLMNDLDKIRKSSATTNENKENILGVSGKTNKSKEEDLRKENAVLKRKVVLIENAKNNVEKVLKDLREQSKKKEEPSYSDVLYKQLLQQYIEVKEDNQRLVKEKETQQFEIKNQPLMNIKIEDQDKLTQDIKNVREAYGNVMDANSKLELEIMTLRKVIEERNCDLDNMSHIKEAYEKLLEENTKVLTEIDTIKYKRMKDKEEFVRLLKKEREDSVNREAAKIQDVRTEYEGKLEKMKEKMLKLYRDEVNKKVQSVKEGKSENVILLKSIDNLRADLLEADQKIQLLQMERDILKANKHMEFETKVIPKRTVSSTSTSRSHERAATLPRGAILEEGSVSRRTSVASFPSNMGQNLQMEDEEDLFNDKYLTDLKEGKCALPSHRESTATRFSELAWRNSLVPPHLKSSYPAELQFVSPNRYKDDDIKAGNVELDDSLCKLLPGEKPRKKDFGTTSYKKPGPPTPSKNGGRLSLQGNEVHPLREVCEMKTPKKSTPSRIRALFTGRNSSTASENQSNSTPNRGMRLNIFRKAR